MSPLERDRLFWSYVAATGIDWLPRDQTIRRQLDREAKTGEDRALTQRAFQLQKRQAVEHTEMRSIEVDGHQVDCEFTVLSRESERAMEQADRAAAYLCARHASERLAQRRGVPTCGRRRGVRRRGTSRARRSARASGGGSSGSGDGSGSSEGSDGEPAPPVGQQGRTVVA